ncbi:UNVERIFIED_CONTAM: hypothetical protein Scaly_0285600 [Sesamum calycinum]|uniref:Ty3 transposon capsid-like protein domain-containing protein n=1 Tax=Sesamum calycinum TaxID=2727403 RepID=A0AAW2S9V4_9LAMI
MVVDHDRCLVEDERLTLGPALRRSKRAGVPVSVRLLPGIAILSADRRISGERERQQQAPAPPCALTPISGLRNGDADWPQSYRSLDQQAMADGTGLKELQEPLKTNEILPIQENAWSVATEEHSQAQLEHIARLQESFQITLHNLENSPMNMQQQYSAVLRNYKLTIATNLYWGDNPRAWIRKCNRYFQLISTIGEDQKVPLASVHLEGKADVWFQGSMEGKGSLSWQEFVSAVLERFEDLDCEKVMGKFSKLLQETTVNAYLDKFEELNSYMMEFNKDFNEEFFLMKFISGLRKDIKGLTSTMKPKTLNQAIILAKNQEATADAIVKRLYLGISVKSHNYICLNEEESKAYAEDVDYIEEQVEKVEDEDKAISIKAMAGNTLTMKGNVNGKDVNILVATGSTHSFVDESVMQSLGCKVEYTTPMMLV